MEVANVTFQKLLATTNQFMIPLFQRQYTWRKDNWKQLWEDIIEQIESENKEPHFMGSLVSSQGISVPQGVPKYVLIDGQQRTTTIIILLAALRDQLLQSMDPNVKRKGEEIHGTILINSYGSDLDRYKLLPTQHDREAFFAIIESNGNGITSPVATHKMLDAYGFFEKELKNLHKKSADRNNPITLLRFVDTVLSGLSVVSITLSPNDNPYAVFESLNAKGLPLSQGDLVRNYIFMGIHRDQQVEMYDKYWHPMQERLGEENLTDFIRHFLVRFGGMPAGGEVFQSFKGSYRIQDTAIALQDLYASSKVYKNILHGNENLDSDTQQLLSWIRRAEIKTFYPVLIGVDHQVRAGLLLEANFWKIANIILNYTLRRFVCSLPSNIYRSLNDAVTRTLSASPGINGFNEAIKKFAEAGYPSDERVLASLPRVTLYQGGSKAKTRVLLEIIEASYGHKEAANLEAATIEHIMPQTLSPEWRFDLGQNAEQIHEEYLNTIGNLTFSGYNPEMSNQTFSKKRVFLINSHYELNKTVKEATKWGLEEINERAKAIAHQTLLALPSFAPSRPAQTLVINELKDVTGKQPVEVTVIGVKKNVSNWKDVIRHTVDTISDYDDSHLHYVSEWHKSWINTDPARLIQPYKVPNSELFVETHLSAHDIVKRCRKMLELLEMPDEFSLVYN